MGDQLAVYFIGVLTGITLSILVVLTFVGRSVRAAVPRPIEVHNTYLPPEPPDPLPPARRNRTMWGDD